MSDQGESPAGGPPFVERREGPLALEGLIQALTLTADAVNNNSQMLAEFKESNAARAQRERRQNRQILIQTVIILALLAVTLSNRSLANNNHKILNDIEAVTNPQAQARQSATVGSLVGQVIICVDNFNHHLADPNVPLLAGPMRADAKTGAWTGCPTVQPGAG